MKNGVIGRFVWGAALLVAAGNLWAADHYKVVNGPTDFYYGHISYVEPGTQGPAPMILREGKPEPEEAVLNAPVGPGDTVRTTADCRVEIQFDTGTIVRLDFATDFRVQTILARSLTRLDQLSVMALDKGRIYVQYREYDGREMFQILTPNAAVKMKHNSVVFVTAAADGATEAQVKYGRALVRFGPAANRLDDRTVNKGQRLIVLADHQSELSSAIDGTAFELWNKEVNDRFWDLHEGLSALPKPLQKLPPAVFFFAQTLGSRYGEWLWDDLFGYVWRPYIDNGAYPWGWQPYFYGHWLTSGARMFWVPREPWGWIPYHLGIWHWSKKIGWVWLPGSMFAPAWATWDFYFGYACWRPWGLYDWMYGYYDPFGMSGFSYLNGGWAYSPYGAVGSVAPTVVRKDHLKQPADSPYPIPAELKRVLASLTEASKRGDTRVLEEAAEASRHLVFVNKRDLATKAIEQKALTWDRVPKSGAPAEGSDGRVRRLVDPQREAARVLRGIDGPAAAPRRIMAPASREAVGGRAPAVPVAPPGRSDAAIRRNEPAAARFRDWNPDLRVARDLGVRILYSSATNEVRCPELGISSRDRELPSRLAPHLTSHGVSYGPGRSVDPSLTSDFSGSGAPPAGDGQAGTSSRSSGASEKQDSGGSKGGQIKK